MDTSWTRAGDIKTHDALNFVFEFLKFKDRFYKKKLFDKLSLLFKLKILSFFSKLILWISTGISKN